MKTNPGWTPEAIRALGPTTDVRTLGSIFGRHPNTAYAMRRQGRWEAIGIRIILVGARYQVAVQSILDVLGCTPAGSNTTTGDPAASQPTAQGRPGRTAGSALSVSAGQ
jgi:hypothetical protein